VQFLVIFYVFRILFFVVVSYVVFHWCPSLSRWHQILYIDFVFSDEMSFDITDFFLWYLIDFCDLKRLKLYLIKIIRFPSCIICYILLLTFYTIFFSPNFNLKKLLAFQMYIYVSQIKWFQRVFMENQPILSNIKEYQSLGDYPINQHPNFNVTKLFAFQIPTHGSRFCLWQNIYNNLEYT
jgi:hypothetical protein